MHKCTIIISIWQVSALNTLSTPDPDPDPHISDSIDYQDCPPLESWHLDILVSKSQESAYMWPIYCESRSKMLICVHKYEILSANLQP